MDALTVEHVSKRYGDVVALHDVTFSVPQGSIFGLLGPNGAGKTTLIKSILGLTYTDGAIRINGKPIDAAGRARIGYVPDVPELDSYLTAAEYLRSVGRLYSVPPEKLEHRIPIILDAVGLAGISTKIRGYSRGMRQRLGIGQALIHGPDLLILDEPTTALDPGGRRDILELIREVSAHATIIFSTHRLEDVDRLCDRVLMLRNTVVADSLVSDLRSAIKPRLVVELVDRTEEFTQLLAQQPWVVNVQHANAGLLVDLGDAQRAAHEMPALLAAGGFGLKRMEPVSPTMEDIFFGLMEESSHV